MKRLLSASVLGCAALLGGAALAADGVTISMHAITAEGVGPAVGQVTIGGAPAAFTTDLKGLPPGQHGFHLHANPDCGPANDPTGKMAAGMAAGSHWDPAQTAKHLGPAGDGHMGDLPVLTVAADGTARETLQAPRLTDLAALKGRSLMIHAGGDTYAEPPPNGGGAARIACGVIE